MDRRQFNAISLAAASAVWGREGLAEDSLLTRCDTSTVRAMINEPDWVLVDTRPSDAYNGWRLDGIARGGHLPGAVDFPATWLDNQRKDKNSVLSAALATKGITPQRKILLYGTDEQDRLRVARFLSNRGFQHLHGYDLHDWVKDPAHPLERYPNFQLIVPATIVKQLMEGEVPETFDESTSRLKLVETSWGDETASYAQGHVPGSFHVNTDHFEPPPSWMLGNANTLSKFARRYGFQHNDTVIVSSKDPMASYRLAIVLRYMGMHDVRVLNGGSDAWESAGFELETERHDPLKTESFGAAIPGRPELIDTIDQVKRNRNQSSAFTLVDTRTWAEFCGETSGYSYHRRKGRVPGSVYGQHDFRGKNSLTPYRNIDQTMRNADEIQRLWKRSGIHPDAHLSFFCGSGWRAAEVLTYAQVMGLANTSLYSDGWIGWSNDPGNPTETGVPQPVVDES